MNKRQHNPVRTPAIQITLALTLVAISASLLASTSEAAPVISQPSQGCGRIDTPDVAAVLQHIFIAPLTGCALTAGDVNNDGFVNNVDAIAIQRFYTGFTAGNNRSGTDAGCGRCYGDTTTSTNSPLPGVTVSLPTANLDTSINSSTLILLPVVTTNIDSSLGIVGFQGDFTFDERVVTFPSQPVVTADLTPGAWHVSGNILPGAGPFRTLRVSFCYANGFDPISGSGTLFNLRILRVSSTPGDMSNLVWTSSPDDFQFVNNALSTVSPLQNNGLITITGPTPTPAPPTPTPTPTSAPSCGRIDTADSFAVEEHIFSNPPLTGCSLVAADVNNDGSVTQIDFITIMRFYLGFTSGTGRTGTDTGCGLCYGDVVSGTSSPLPGVTVSLPTANLDTSVDITTVIIQPVATTTIDASSGFIGFQGDFTFDERVVTFASVPTFREGLTSPSNWTLSGNILPGSGPFRTLRVSGFALDGTPISGSGTLFGLRMLRVSSTPGDMSNLVPVVSQENFEFIATTRNYFVPTETAGLITITGPTPTPAPSSTPTATPPVCGTFSNFTFIQVPGASDRGPASPYPSNIAVSGLGGLITKVTVAINGVTHSSPDDIDILLVGPAGQNAIIMSDVGGSPPCSLVNLILDDSAATDLPDNGPLVSGTFRPTNIGAGDSFDSPAPVPSGNVALSTFNGTNPNGTWSLYVFDDSSSEAGNLQTGWSITITTDNCISPTPTPTPEPSPTPTPAPTSTPTATPPVCGTFSNFAFIQVPGASDRGPASPYPSNIAVSGLGGLITKVTVAINGVTHSSPDDIDILLVSPAGQNAIIMSDVGGSPPCSLVNLILDDSAATDLPDNGPLVSGTFRPTNIGAGDSFDSPAPVPSGNVALSTFNGTNPNGTWSLYVFDDSSSEAGNLQTGWSITITTDNCSSPTPTPTPEPSPTPTPAPTCGRIDTADSVRVNRHFQGLALLTGCPLTAADVNVNGSINTQDVIAILRFYLGFTSGISSTGTDSGCGLCRGDVSSGSNSTLPGVTVSLPTANLDTSVNISTVVNLPVATTNIDPSMDLISFQGDFTFDERVVTFSPAGAPVLPAGLTGSGWTVAGNILPGAGPFRTLRVSAFANDVRTPLSGSGTLFNLKTLRVSSTPGDMSNLIWRTSPDDFQFIQTTLNTFSPTQNAGLITITGPTPTPPTVIISGRVGNCASPAPTGTPPATPTPPTLPGVPNVVMTLTGSSSGTTLTDASGNYSFTVAAGGSYIVTPSKGPLPPASPGINTTDVLAIQRHYLGIITIPAGCRLAAGDVFVNAVVNTADAICVQKFFQGFTANVGSCGEYKFIPANQAYPAIATNQTGQDYAMYIRGDVSPSFANRPAEGLLDAPEESELTYSSVTSVDLPVITVNQARRDFTAPVTSSLIDANDNLVGFQGDFTFDERVVTFANEAVQPAGLTANNWSVAGNVLPGEGPIRTFRISAYSTDFVPLSGIGTLFDLKIAHVNGGAVSSPLIWAAPPDNFIFINGDLMSQKPGNTVNPPSTTVR